MAILCVVMLIGYLWNRQIVIISNNKICVKNCLKTLVTLEISECAFQIAVLPTNHSWAGRIKQKWICVYDIKNTETFVGGCENNPKHKRIQIIFNEDNFRAIEEHIQPME